MTIDKTNGATAADATLASCSQSLAIDWNETFYSIDRDTSAVQVLDAGALVELDPLEIAINDTSSLAIVPGTDELLLFQLETSNTICTVDKVSGLATLVGTFCGVTRISAVALAPDDLFANGVEE